MTVETVDNGVAPNGDVLWTPNVTVSSKNSRESDRRRRRRKQKKNNKGSEVDVEEGNVSGASSKENADPQQQIAEEVVVEYVPEQPEFEDCFDDEIRKIFEKFNFRESVTSEEDGKKDESEEKADVKKKLDSDSDSDSDEDEQNNHQKEKDISNKKKK